MCGPGSSGSKVLDYGLDGQGSIPGVGNFSSLLHVQTGPGVHSASYKMSKRDFPGVKATELRTSAVAVYM